MAAGAWTAGRRWGEGLVIALVVAFILWWFRRHLGYGFAVAIPAAVLFMAVCWWGETGFKVPRPGRKAAERRKVSEVSVPDQVARFRTLSGWIARHVWDSRFRPGTRMVLLMLRPPSSREWERSVICEVVDPGGSVARAAPEQIIPPGLWHGAQEFSTAYPLNFPKARQPPILDGKYEVRWFVEGGVGAQVAALGYFYVDGGVVLEGGPGSPPMSSLREPELLIGGRAIHPNTGYQPGHEYADGLLTLTLKIEHPTPAKSIECWIAVDQDPWVAAKFARCPVPDVRKAVGGRLVGIPTLRLPYPGEFDNAFPLVIDHPHQVRWFARGLQDTLAEYEFTPREQTRGPS